MPDPSSTLAGSSPALLPPNGTSNSTTNTNAQAGPSSPPRNTYTTSNDDIPMNGETTPRTNGDGTADMSLLFTAKREEELARRDRSLAEFLVMLDGYKPVIPEEVTEYYLERAGFECSDPRLKRLLSLSAQKFISDLSRDAYHFAKLRINGTAVGRGRPAAGVDRNRVVLTMDDLSLALSEHGVNVKKPDYYL